MKLPFIKKISTPAIIQLMMLLNSNVTFCQSNNIVKKLKQLDFYSNSGFGIFYPKTQTDLLANNGIAYNFQLQIINRKHAFTRVTFDQYSIGYFNTVVNNGVNFSLKNKMQLSNVGLDAGYNFKLARKVFSYTYFGLGYAIQEVPGAQYNAIYNNATLSILKKQFLSAKIGIGIEYVFDKHLTLFTEAQYFSLPITSLLANKPLHTIGINVGFKTPLQ